MFPATLTVLISTMTLSPSIFLTSPYTGESFLTRRPSSVRQSSPRRIFSVDPAITTWSECTYARMAFRLLLLCKATVLNLVLASGAFFVSSFFSTFFFSCFLFFFFRSSRVILSRFSCVGRI